MNGSISTLFTNIKLITKIILKRYLWGKKNWEWRVNGWGIAVLYAYHLLNHIVFTCLYYLNENNLAIISTCFTYTQQSIKVIFASILLLALETV